MGDQDKEKSMENPDVVHKVCDRPWLHQTERTVHATAQRLCSVPKSQSGSPYLFQFVYLLFSLVKHKRVVLVESKGHVPRFWPNITKPLA
ncbi:hypothetical protein YC2023_108204 [Brassica napus]